MLKRGRKEQVREEIRRTELPDLMSGVLKAGETILRTGEREEPKLGKTREVARVVVQ